MDGECAVEGGRAADDCRGVGTTPPFAWRPGYGSASLSPGGAGRAMIAASPVATGRGMRIRLPCAGDRRLEGERDGSKSGRPAATVAVEAPAMAAECGDRREAHGPLAAHPSEPAGCSLQRCPKSPQRGCRKATQGTPKVPEGPHQGPSSRPGRVCWGRRTTGPRVAERRPRTRRASLRPRRRGKETACGEWGASARCTRGDGGRCSHTQDGGMN